MKDGILRNPLIHVPAYQFFVGCIAPDRQPTGTNSAQKLRSYLMSKPEKPVTREAYFSPTLDQQRLSSRALRVLACIARRGRTGAWTVSNRRIALATGLSQETVWRAIATLIDERLVRALGRRRSHDSKPFHDLNPFRAGAARRLRLTYAAARAIRIPPDIDSAGFTVGAFRLLLHVISCEAGTEGCQHSLRCLSRQLRMRRLTIKRSVTELLKGAWIKEASTGTLISRYHDPSVAVPEDRYKPHTHVHFNFHTPTRRQVEAVSERFKKLTRASRKDGHVQADCPSRIFSKKKSRRGKTSSSLACEKRLFNSQSWSSVCESR